VACVVRVSDYSDGVDSGRAFKFDVGDEKGITYTALRTGKFLF
jgi:hypothetical protein